MKILANEIRHRFFYCKRWKNYHQRLFASIITTYLLYKGVTLHTNNICTTN